MAALFDNLHDIAQVLAEYIRAEVGIEDVQAGHPRDVAATTVAGARLTFLYATPQPGHRNDVLERRPDGSRPFPPLSLSCFYVVTTSGADGDDPIAAHLALGRIMTLFHDRPSLRLPLSDPADPDAFPELGEGTLDVVQVPIAADQVDKIWTSFDLPLQPWALFEVSAVQLVSQRDALGPAPVVAPGGIGLQVRTGTRPRVRRMTPDPVRPEGRVRVDVDLPAGVEAVVVDGIHATPGGASLTATDGGSPMLLRLDTGGLDALGPGAHHLSVRSRGLVSRRTVLRIAEETTPLVDAPPALVHDPATDLVLSGANLGAAEECLMWPDAGMATPGEVHTMELSAVSATSVTIASAHLGGLAPAAATWRLAIRIGARHFTPYVLVELAG